VVEQVLGGFDALGGEHFRHARTDAAHVHYRSIEASHTPDAKWLTGGGTNRARMKRASLQYPAAATDAENRQDNVRRNAEISDPLRR
jgi:hypothetical protein